MDQAYSLVITFYELISKFFTSFLQSSCKLVLFENQTSLGEWKFTVIDLTGNCFLSCAASNASVDLLYDAFIVEVIFCYCRFSISE